MENFYGKKVTSLKWLQIWPKCFSPSQRLLGWCNKRGHNGPNEHENNNGSNMSLAALMGLHNLAQLKSRPFGPSLLGLRIQLFKAYLVMILENIYISVRLENNFFYIEKIFLKLLSNRFSVVLKRITGKSTHSCK